MKQNYLDRNAGTLFAPGNKEAYHLVKKWAEPTVVSS